MLRVAERVVGIEAGGELPVRGEPRQRERHPLALGELEFRDGGQVFAVDGSGCAEAERVRARGRDARVVHAPHPGHDPAVAEADHELRAHAHPPREPFDDAHDVRRVAAWRHEVDHADAPLCGLPLGLENERRVAVAADRARRLDRRDEPAPVTPVSEQRREAGVRVEAREAAPVDRPLAMDERRRLEVRDERVVLDQACHLRAIVTRRTARVHLQRPARGRAAALRGSRAGRRSR